ncbi:Usp domain-containing protein [Paracoccidioides lutzii Pb01]|uniref:Usp domain-containing protein n=1 Tax=Paracoccidioides lutzii (strain ATCC MYA-826 / Pb01) TaxID=502779 RepID=C1H6V5_PARBA|nr:Usp domain-containing protein [Paracoccidioides lutzii Pb01]EEH35449.1 Usp domain-containing protein [Paracoccidioides lutzii Pb01]
MAESISPTTSPGTGFQALGSDDTVQPHQGDSSVSTLDGSSAVAAEILRRRSIQFNVPNATTELSRKRAESTRSLTHRGSLGRIPSPPPPSAYNRGVSFDTFDNRDATDFSLTLNYKHKDYQATRRSRTFLCGTDQNEYSDFALEWLIDELVDDGDEIVCLRVVEKDSKIASDASVEERKYRQEAQKLLDQVIAKNSQDEKAISLVMELAVGKVQEIIQRMIQIYEPSVLIVGTRGRSLGGMQVLLPGSVSKYCLQQSPIPVIVVRPTAKREKKKQKRLANPSRQRYNHLLRLSDMKSGRVFDASHSANSRAVKFPEEGAAVGQAAGTRPGGEQEYQNHHLSFSKDTASDDVDDDEGRSESRRSSSVFGSKVSGSGSELSPGMTEAGMRDIESPAVTDGENEDDREHEHGHDDGGALERERERTAQELTPTPPDGRRSEDANAVANANANVQAPKTPLVPITNVNVREYSQNVDEPH